ncbi:YggT family protein [Weissella uvarum]|uniref:YggT family protein n=1 Tax=Weissella uvarum TaxID=1479233 RepID=UPI00196006C5|nr:YggT family protein [Weissella uvarum]MBM7617786.1 YggT family protein [Weissella uvarum]MCM0595835.1 YggT family protein [Weissella uvarum]
MAMILTLVGYGLRAFEWIIIIWALMSWIPALRDSKVGQLITRLAEIVVGPIQRIVPPIGMIDFSPVIALILLQAAQYGVFSIMNALS